MSKHPAPDRQPADLPDDLERNPGIGQSRGVDNREDLDVLEGENTVVGDVANDVTRSGGVDLDQRGRTNR